MVDYDVRAWWVYKPLTMILWAEEEKIIRTRRLKKDQQKSKRVGDDYCQETERSEGQWVRERERGRV